MSSESILLKEKPLKHTQGLNIKKNNLLNFYNTIQQLITDRSRSSVQHVGQGAIHWGEHEALRVGYYC